MFFYTIIPTFWFKGPLINWRIILAKEELIEMNGIVDEILPDSRYRVTLKTGTYWWHTRAGK